MDIKQLSFRIPDALNTKMKEMADNQNISANTLAIIIFETATTHPMVNETIIQKIESKKIRGPKTHVRKSRKITKYAKNIIITYIANGRTISSVIKLPSIPRQGDIVTIDQTDYQAECIKYNLDYPDDVEVFLGLKKHNTEEV